MKFLYLFLMFQLDKFLQGKELTVTGCRPWKDFDTQKELGTVVDVAITKDNTQYPVGKDGGTQTNLFEKFSIKLPKFNFSVPVGAVVTIVNGNPTVYGDRRDKLSVRAEDVKVIAPPTSGGKEV